MITLKELKSLIILEIEKQETLNDLHIEITRLYNHFEVNKELLNKEVN